MDFMQFLQTSWFILIGLLLAGYTILDGFDLGIGALLPVMARDERETGALLSAIWPVWDGNEVWLLAAGGALFAAFPHVYATVFSGFYLAFMLVLFALIFRAVSFEFWGLDQKRRFIWKWTFTAGSALPPVLYGIALGNVIQGVPLDASMEFTGGFLALLRPFPIAMGLLGLAAVSLQGCSFAALKSTGRIHDRARKLGRASAVLFGAALVLSALLAHYFVPDGTARLSAWIFAAASLAAAAAAWALLGRPRDLPPFIASSLALVSLWGLAGSSLFPALVRSSGPGGDLTMYNSSSTELTLTVMLIIAGIGMPFVIGYTIFVYRIFRGKVSL